MQASNYLGKTNYDPPRSALNPLASHGVLFMICSDWSSAEFPNRLQKFNSLGIKLVFCKRSVSVRWFGAPLHPTIPGSKFPNFLGLHWRIQVVVNPFCKAQMIVTNAFILEPHLCVGNSNFGFIHVEMSCPCKLSNIELRSLKAQSTPHCLNWLYSFRFKYIKRTPAEEQSYDDSIRFSNEQAY